MRDQLPPHSMEAEQGALGCCMLDPQALDTAQEFGALDLWFYDLRHQTLWATLCAMQRQGKPTHDMIALGETLRASGQLESVGGLTYLSQLMDCTPSAANVGYYLGIVAEKFRLRSLLSAATGIIQAVRENEHDAETAIDEAETAILGVRGGRVDKGDRTAKQIAESAISAMEDRIKGREERLTTGWRGLDRITKGGWVGGNMIVIAGRPATGKTALAITAARLMARSGIPVGIVSLEMSDAELGGRFLAQESRMDWGKFDQQNRPNEGDMRRMVSGAGNFGRLPITVWEGHSVTIGAIAAKARRWVRNGVRMLIVDYLQLVNGNPKRERREQVGEISRGIKGMARELKIPVMVLAQLNRDIEKDKSRKPKLSDLRESGDIEQDADFVGMLYKADNHDDQVDGYSPTINVNLHIAKQRGGIANTDLQFVFNRELTEFAEPERERLE